MKNKPVDLHRSAIMRAVKSKDTKPELLVRSYVHRLGYRFRLHKKDLPGVPDLTFIRLHSVIFIHGCFWHGHSCARGNRTPKTNREYWQAKIARNKDRDRIVRARLHRLGWRSLVVWECDLAGKPERAMRRIASFLENAR